MDSGSRKPTTRQEFEDNQSTQVGIRRSGRWTGVMTAFSSRSPSHTAQTRDAIAFFQYFSETYACTSQGWHVPMLSRPIFRRAYQELTP